MASTAAYASEGGERGFDPTGAIASLVGIGFDADDVSVPLAASGSSTVTDANTLGNWENGLRDSTENVGRIWVDKTVEDSDITPSPSPITIKRGEADFLVGLSALSSTSNLATTVSTPLDIVLVLDTSGSMNEGMGDPFYNEVTSVQETSGRSFAPDYYVKQGDDYVRVTENTSGSFWGRQHVGWEVNGHAIEPKTDQNPNGVQFYQHIQLTRLDALQNAANAFIDETAKTNKSIADSANKHSISIVTFASNANTRAGLTTVDDDHVDGLKNTVNSLEAKGSTAADYGMQHAQNVLKDARDGAQKVVIFFTDGEPNHQNGFDNEVAAATVNAACAIKQGDTLLYSVGVMEGSDPNGTDDYNSYMNAVSSNYPNATAQGGNGGFSGDGYFTITWGDRVADASYYKAADNAKDLNRIFEDIFEEINTSAGLPTRVDNGDPAHGGYLTFTDRLGAYMEVDPSNMTVMYADESFSNPTSSIDGNITAYHFEGAVATGNPDYPEGSMADLIVEVEHGDDMATGDVVTVKIPAALIPLRTYGVDTTEGQESFTTNAASPIRVFYGVSLKGEAASSLADPDAKLQSYIDANKDENGNVLFYSNLYEETDGAAGDAEHGNTTAAFEPAEGNSFYYFTANTPVYVNETCSTPATRENLASFNTFYYELDHYEKDGDGFKKQAEAYSLPSSSLTFLGDAIGFDTVGNAYVKAGQPRLTNIKNFSDEKEGNETSTASTVVSPEWVSEQTVGIVNSYLGNNGVLSAKLPGTLAISKNVIVPEGFDEEGYASTEFAFEIVMDEAANRSFDAVVENDEGAIQGVRFPLSFDEQGKAGFEIADGQTLFIYGLSDGWKYTVAETDVPQGFTSRSNGEFGTVLGGATTAANFINAYSATPVTLDGSTNLTGTKAIDGRNWLDTDEFEFGISPAPNSPEDTPMPENAEISVKGSDVADKTGLASFSFGDIVYTKPGTYVYKVFEIAGGNASIVYDGHKATVTVTVVDNHDGTLSSTAVVANGAFSNAYKAELLLSQRVSASISKTLTGRDMEAGQFEFTAKPLDELSADRLGISTEGRVVRSEAAADGEAALMPLDFDGITFTADDDGKRYGLVVTETKGGGAGYANDDESAIVTFDVKDDGNGLLAVTITVLKGDDEPQTFIETNADDTMVGVAIPFANSYAATGALGGEGNAVIHATKVLTGRDLVEGEFSFQVVDAKGNVVATGTNAADGTIGFSAIPYSTDSFAEDVASGIATKTEAGYEYVYEVSEVTDGFAASGITSIKDSFAVAVHVTDGGDGTLGIAVDYGSEGGGLTFQNVYDPQAVSKSIDGRKVIDGGGSGSAPTQEDIAGAYTFTLTGFAADDGTPAPMPQGAGADSAKTVVNDAVGNVSFGEIEYTVANVWPESQAIAEAGEAAARTGATRSKTFTYSVTEAGAFPGVANEGGIKTFAVTVTDNGDGTLSAATDPAACPLFTFTNVYGVDPAHSSLTGEGGVPVTKILTGRDLVEGEFSFALRDAATGEVVAEAANAADGTVEMPALTFDAAGVYAYRLSEAPGDRGGVTYDGAVYDVTATATDDGAGALDVAWSVEKGEEALEAVTFRNSYEAAPTSIALEASKILTGRDLVEGEFSFVLRDAATGEVVTEAANAADGSVFFGRIEYDEAGTYEYEIAEVEGDAEGITYDDAAFAVRVDVVDDGDGHLSAVDWSYGKNGAPVFENAYERPSAPQAANPEPLPGGSLVQTGDAMPARVAAGMALAAAVVACAAALRLRRSRRNGRRLR